MSESHKLPELLCPAGSEESLLAAIEGGADAVYLGGTQMNARMHAGNFDPRQLREAVKRAHIYGVKVYLTLNTLVTDRELTACLDAARDAANAGVDALIVADAGAASLIHRAIPSLELHASTQMSGHNSLMGAELKSLGFSRMVVAREISERDLAALVASSPIETELFIHGALCVSHSGQCLFSSMVGGRSGNRGDCAQPCRLPYACAARGRGSKSPKESYPLSLKDLSLAAHTPRLIELGISSLKIEGRMKSPEYVYNTARIWRRLLDENRAATREELRLMADAFSRSGFTDGYFTGRVDDSMLGVRREADKQISRGVEPFGGLQKKAPVRLSCRVEADRPVSLTLQAGERKVTALGEPPQQAITAPMTAEAVERSLSRFGGTPFAVSAATVTVGEGLMLPVSKLNDLRRRATEALLETYAPNPVSEAEWKPCRPIGKRAGICSARFRWAEQITPRAQAYFQRIYLPLERFRAPANGVLLPPVIFDGDLSQVEGMLRDAREKGAVYAMLGNMGHLSMVKKAGLIPVGDLRLNIANGETAALYEALGLDEMILSPELTLPQMRDVGGNTAVVVYGRLPLMLLERCVARSAAGCDACGRDAAQLTDRRGAIFPILREWKHRSLIVNSLPTCMSDRRDALVRNRLENQHFLFYTETPREVDRVIDCFGAGKPLGEPVRRIAN
ncbi:MAG: U32 family peptidase [Ruminococcaceae bacterium]|nr:U32 family peptidase [Oscillospiraceae bacterium]